MTYDEWRSDDDTPRVPTLTEAFEAGRQSVLQGGVVVPRDLLISVDTYLAWRLQLVQGRDAEADHLRTDIIDLLAGTPDIQGNDRKPEPRSPEFKYQAESLNAISFGTPEQDGQK